MKFVDFINESKLKEGNTYSVKGKTTKGLDVYLKAATFTGMHKSNVSGKWVSTFRRQDTGGSFSFEGNIKTGPPDWS